MNISNLTLEERERLAYIEGNVELASLLGMVIDSKEDLEWYLNEDGLYD
jgi:hypothetical protein